MDLNNIMNIQYWNKTKSLYANIGKLITSSLKNDEIFEGIMNEINTFFGPENWSLLRLDPNSNRLFFSLMNNFNEEDYNDISLKAGEGIAGVVAATGESIFVPDTSQDPRFSDRIDKLLGFKTKSIIAVPLLFRETVYGVIEIVNKKNGELYNEDEHLILKTIADFSAIAFCNSQLHDQVIYQSMRDPLTGLFNHAKLSVVIEEMENLAIPRRRSRDEISDIQVAFIDLDNFKEINDKYGHREGDRILKKTSENLKKLIREDDLLFRVGGDEFLIIIQLPPGEDRIAVENRILQGLSDMTCCSEEFGYSAGFSFGISTGPSYKINDLIHDADINMYRDKNRV